MADLDDFFAKKDKKKSRVVKKFTTSELLSSKQTEDVAAIQALPKKPAEPKKKDETSQNSQNEVESQKPQEIVQEEEWGEFEQEKERDYSGLKIQKLQIQDYEEDEENYEEQELDEEGEVIRREPVGPWNKTGAQQPSSNVKAKEPAPVEVLPNTTGGVYIPPSKRMGSGVSTNKSRLGKKEKGAPDVSNELSFPSLSAAVAIEQNAFKLKKFDQQERGFIEQKPSRSQSSRNAGGDEGPRLHLGNKFHALSNDD